MLLVITPQMEVSHNELSQFSIVKVSTLCAELDLQMAGLSKSISKNEESLNFLYMLVAKSLHF